MIKKLPLWVLLFSWISTTAQTTFEGTVKGTVLGSDQKMVEFANVILQRSADSVFVKATLTDAQGRFELDKVAEGHYFVVISQIGYQKTYSPAFFVNTNNTTVNLSDLLMKTEDKNLKEVTVRATKPFIERELGKVIINVENSLVSAGATAIEVLERSPGLFVDSDGRITFKGRSGVIVMIDGKPSPLSAADLATYLRSLPSNVIEKVELIANPSAKYDASGNSGIINIKLRKEKNLGTNGSINLSAGHGRYHKLNGGITLNHRTKKLNIFGNLNTVANKGFNNLVLDRNFSENGKVTGVFLQNNDISFPVKSLIPRVGLDYYATKKTTLGVVVSGLFNEFSPGGNNKTDVLDGSRVKTGSFATVNNTQSSWYNFAANANLKHTFDSTGKELTVDFDYARYFNTSDQNFTTDYFNAKDELLRRAILIGDVKGGLNLLSFKADYVMPVSKKHKIETGLKTSFVKNDNDIKFFDRVGENDQYNKNLSNHFIYDENINAAYLNFISQAEKINWQLGLRAEHTLANGNQINTDSSFHRNYLQFFPSLSVNYDYSKKHSLSLTLSRRIDRPNYRQLNPFKFFLDPTTYQEGNPFLLPQMTYAAEVSHTFNKAYTLSVSYNRTTDYIGSVLLQNDADRVTIQTDKNIATSNNYGLEFSASKKIGKWWNSNTTLNAFYNDFKGVIANASLNQGSPSFSINSSNSFVLPAKSTLEANIVYLHKQTYTISYLQPFFNFSVGYQKQILKSQGTVRLNVSDIFWKNYPRGGTKFANINETFVSKRDSRVATVTLTYRFGKNTVAPVRRRSSGAEEEKRRVQVG